MGVKIREQRKELIKENHLDDQKARWFAVWVEVQCEKMVFRQLQKKGIKCYLPLKKERKHYKKCKPKWVEKVVLRGYVFVQIVKGEAVEVLQTEKVKGFLKIKNNLLHIPNEEIELLKRFLNDVEGEVLICSDCQFEPGTRVKIVRGPMLGYEGYLVEKRNKNFFVVHLDVLGTSMAMEVETKNLERIS